MTTNVLGPKVEMGLVRFSRAENGRWLVLYQDNRAIQLLPTGTKALKLLKKLKNPGSVFHIAQLDCTTQTESFDINDLVTADNRPIGSLTFEFKVKLTPENESANAVILREINANDVKFLDVMVNKIIQDVKNRIRKSASSIDAMTLQFDSETSLINGEDAIFSRSEIEITGITKTGGNYFAANVVREMIKRRDIADTIETIKDTRDLEAENKKHEIAVNDDLDRTGHEVDRRRALLHQLEAREDHLTFQQHEEEVARRDQEHRIRMAEIDVMSQREIRAVYIRGVLDEARLLGVDPFSIAHENQWTTLVNSNRAMAEELIRQLGSGRISNDQLAAVIDYMRNPADVFPREREEAARIVKGIDPSWKAPSQSARRRADVPGLKVNESIAEAWWRAGGDRETLTGASFWKGQELSAVLIVGNPKPVLPATFHSRLATLSKINVRIESEVVEGRTIQDVIVAFTQILARERDKDISVQVRHRVLEEELVVELSGASKDVRSVLEEITNEELPYVPLLEELVDPPVRVRFLPAVEQ